MKLEKNKSIQALNTLAIPSTAEYFCSVQDRDQLQQAVVWAKENYKRIRVIGGGSNMVFPSEIKGLLIQPALKGMAVVSEDHDHVLLKIGAGENWHNLVKYCIAKGYYGIENLALIPGSVGAAPIQNIGAYGVELHQVLDSVTTFSLSSLKDEVFSVYECELGYRDSIFKHRLKNKNIITHVVLKLSKIDAPNLSYPQVKSLFARDDTIDCTDVFNAIVDLRQRKLPSPEVTPNAGSFFKNPIIDHNVLSRLKTEYPDMPCYPFGEYYKIPAAWLIDQAGWKENTINGVQVHKNQPLVLINPEKKDQQEVLDFACAIQDDIKRRFGIELEIEPEVIN